MKILRFFICIALAVITLAAYWQVLGYEFVNYDDTRYITENQRVQAGLTWEGILWGLTSSYFSNWHPMTWWSHMAGVELFGMNPGGHHLINVLLHIVNTLLLYLVFERMTQALWTSGFVAALFALHPLHVESVAWVAERKDILSGLFFMLTLWAYSSYVKKPSPGKYIWVIFWFLMGFLSKPMVVTLPYLLLLLDVWPLNRLEPKHSKPNGQPRTTLFQLIHEKIPLFLLSVVMSAITFWVQKSGGAVKSLNLFPIQARISNAFVSYIAYLKKTLWPTSLSVFYPHPENSLPVWKGLVCATILISITLGVLKFFRQLPYLAVGWFWYLLALVPVIGIVQVGRQAMADRYTYLPLIGIFIMTSWGIQNLSKQWRYRDKLIAISATTLISSCVVLTWIQTSHWKNSVTLFQHAIDVTKHPYPSFTAVYNNLGSALYEQNKKALAMSYFKAALKLNPVDSMAHYNLASALNDIGIHDRAIEHYQAALMANPGDANIHNNLGGVLYNLGKRERAIEHYRSALELDPDHTQAHFNLGNALSNQGKQEQAMDHFQLVLKGNAGHAPAHFNLGNIFFEQGKLDQAISHYYAALKLDPKNTYLHNNLGTALTGRKELEKAKVHFQASIKYKPDYADVYFNLGVLFEMQNNYLEAAKYFAKAEAINPSFKSRPEVSKPLAQKNVR